MTLSPVSRGHTAGLRLKTEFSTFDGLPPVGALSTPVTHLSHYPASPAGHGWSSLKTASSETQPTSVSSFNSSRGSFTPPYHGTPYSAISEGGMSIDRAQLDKPYAVFSTPTHTPGSTTGQNWHPIMYPNPVQSHEDLPVCSYGFDQAPTIAFEFGPVLSANPSEQLEGLDDLTGSLHAYSGPWQCANSHPTAPATSAGYQAPALFPAPIAYGQLSEVTATTSFGNDWSATTAGGCMDVSTVVPSDVQYWSPSASSMDAVSGNESQIPDRPFDSLELDIELPHRSKAVSNIHRPAGRFEGKRYAKGIRKQKKPRMELKRSRSDHSSRLLAVDSLRSPRLRLELQQTQVPATKHPCGWIEPDGTTCGKKFLRLEHLRRHQDTHNGTVYYACPDPWCIKEKHREFRCRKDNLREHFKTHLKVGGTKRNPARTFDEFYGYIQTMYPGEDGAGFIAWLEKWRSKGEHLKPESPTGINRHG